MRQNEDRARRVGHLRQQSVVDVDAGLRGLVAFGSGEGVAVPPQQAPALVVDEADEQVGRRVVFGVQPERDHMARLGDVRVDGREAEERAHSEHRRAFVDGAAAYGCGALVVRSHDNGRVVGQAEVVGHFGAAAANRRACRYDGR